jgi:glyoxylate reductase
LIEILVNKPRNSSTALDHESGQPYDAVGVEVTRRVPRKVLVTKTIFPEAIELLRTELSVDLNTDDRTFSKPDLIARLKAVDGAVTLVTDTLDTEVLESVPNLKIVSNVAVGLNNIDVPAATRLGILVTNTPGVVTESTADFAWALLMAAARRVAEGDRFVRSGQWKVFNFQMLLGHDVYGKTLGIIGLGNIGKAVARRAKGFGMAVQYCGSGRAVPPAEAEGAKEVSFETLLATSDFISVHVPLLPKTTHMISDAAFALMKPTCVFVNSSRGPIVDEKAMVRALQSGKIAAAGLDVFEREPELEPELLTFENVVLAPHIGSSSRETRLKMSMMAAENVMAGLKGQRPPNLVNPEAWERRRC